MLVTQSCLTLCDPLDCSLPGSSVHGNSPGKNTGVGFHSLLQGIFPTQGSNSCLLHCRRILYHLSHHGSDSKILLHLLGSPLRNHQWHSHQSPGLDKAQFFQTYLPLLTRHLSPFSDWFNLSFPNPGFPLLHLGSENSPATISLLSLSDAAALISNSSLNSWTKPL